MDYMHTQYHLFDNDISIRRVRGTIMIRHYAASRRHAFPEDI